MDDLLRWRRSQPDGGTLPAPTKESMARLHEILKHESRLAKVRSYLRGDESGPPSLDVKNFLRWQAVVEARREGCQRLPRKATWLDAYTVASQRLKGKPAAGSPRTMKRAYIAVERLQRHRTK
jgi:hypothetical protein